jgi:hypothetical protein
MGEMSSYQNLNQNGRELQPGSLKVQSEIQTNKIIIIIIIIIYYVCMYVT